MEAASCFAARIRALRRGWVAEGKGHQCGVAETWNETRDGNRSCARDECQPILKHFVPECRYLGFYGFFLSASFSCTLNLRFRAPFSRDNVHG
jgi:hypothetical protein